MSARSDALAAQLAVLRSKAERREAIRRFEDGQMSATDARELHNFRSWLASPGFSTRFAPQGEGSAGIGGNLVPQVWNADLIRQMKEYNGLLSAFELWESDHGQAAERPVALLQAAGVAQTENTAFTEGPNAVLSHQPWGICPTYAASTRASNALVQDAFVSGITPQDGIGGGYKPFGASTNIDGIAPSAPVIRPQSPTLDDMIRSLLGESLGRVLAPVVTTAFYSAINTAGVWSAGNSGGFLQLGAATPIQLTSGASTELTSKTVALDTAAQMVAAIDTAYLPGAAFFMTQTAWLGLARQVDLQKRFQIDISADDRSIMGYPVVLTAGATDAVLSTVSGVVFGNLSAAMTLRVANGQTTLFRSSERYAELAETYFRVTLRADVSVRDSRAMIGVKYAAT